MKRRTLAILLALLLVFTMSGCQKENAVTTEPVNTEPTPANMYARARKALEQEEALELSVEVTIETQAGEECFTTELEQEILLNGRGTKELQVQREEEAILSSMSPNGYSGSWATDFFDVYTGGKLYTLVDEEIAFRGDVPQEGYLTTLFPAVLLDESLYQSVTIKEEQGKQYFTFEQPVAGEEWAMTGGAELISAKGFAIVDATGWLEESRYELSYCRGTIQTTLVAELETKRTAEVVEPVEKPWKYTEVLQVTAIRPYQMCLLRAAAASGVVTNSVSVIEAEVADCASSEVFTTAYEGYGDAFQGNMDWTYVYADSTGAETHTINYHYKDGVDIRTEEGTQPESERMDPEEAMEFYIYYGDLGLVTLHDVYDITLEFIGDIAHFETALTADYAEASANYVLESLVENPGDIIARSEYLQSDTCRAYLTVDMGTELPVAMGYLYEGKHRLDGKTYALREQVDSYANYAGAGVHKAVTGELQPAEKPETGATPLFYRVTGDKGQEMYLLGTIHAGDDRTAFLPQEIYDALDSADALAVECDVQEFEAQMETDMKLLGQIMKLYLVSDLDQRVSALLDAESYRLIEILSRPAGNLQGTMANYKPFVWSSSIDQFFMQQGYWLMSDKGVDMHLLTRAKEKGIPILEIESAAEQTEMLAGFSADLQQMELESYIGAAIWEYNDGLEELYELWCAGDEAALRALLSEEEDLSELTEQERAEYEKLMAEYNKAMSYDRNVGMLETAKEYLESDEVVFYAVGLAHLLDSTNGLVDTLRDAGYTVEQVSYQ